MNPNNDPLGFGCLGQDIFGNTVLHYKLMQRCEISDIEQLLRSKSTDLNSAGFFGYSPMQLAILGRQPSEVINTLIKYGANLEHRDLSGKTALHLVVGLDSTIFNQILLDLLLEHGVDVSTRDIRSQTPLHITVCKERAIDTEMLVKYGASELDQDINIQVDMTSFIYKMSNGNHR